jgi:hypothetical protein
VENWAGRGFNSWPYPTYDEVPFPLQEALLADHEAEILRTVPLTYHETDEEGNVRVVKIGTAVVSSKGTFEATMDDGSKMSGGGLFPCEMSFAPKE